MTTHKNTIQLSRSERSKLYALTRRGTHNARVLTRARILLMSHEGNGKDAIAAKLHIGRSTVQRIRDQFREDGLARALYDAPRSGQPRKLTPKAEAYLVALACSDPPPHPPPHPPTPPPRPGPPGKPPPKAEAYLVALACSAPPKGRDHWTLELLQERLIKENKVRSISTVAIWHRLRDREIKPWRGKKVGGAGSDPALHRADGGRP